jgi:hypothetical protein
MTHLIRRKSKLCHRRLNLLLESRDMVKYASSVQEVEYLVSLKSLVPITAEHLNAWRAQYNSRGGLKGYEYALDALYEVTGTDSD